MSTATILIIAAVFLAGLALGALIISLVLRRRNVPVAREQTAPAKPFKPAVEASTSGQPPPLVFRLRYIAAPLILAVTCLVIALAFVPALPSPLGFRFAGDGTVLTATNKYAFIALMLAAQIVCALAAWAIARTIIRMGRRALKTTQPQIPLDGYIALMSNMILLPQLILAYIMLDALIHGMWERHLISAGLFSILTIAIGSLILIFMFARMLSRAQNVMNKH
jgi:uncharacterized membrane protein